MTRRRVLIQWIGHSDLKALAATLPADRRRKVLECTGGDAGTQTDQGPTKCLLSEVSFDRVLLLSNYPPAINRWFAEWVGTPVTFVPVELQRPTDYGRIFEICEQQLRELKSDRRWSDAEICLHLSPGTPAMTAVWLLLGKTRYPATFYETSRAGKVWITDVPFELLDVIPDVLQKPDSYLQHLASEAPAEIDGFEDIVGNSQPIRDAVGRAKRAAMRSVSVLLLGESGTGKEMFAQAMHRASPRNGAPFKAINCAAISKTLLESELFGHAKGAFTGAEQHRKGAFEAADGGTIFLDEVGECDLDTQAKLLRVLQPITGEGVAVRKVCRLGEEKDRKVDVRIIAATNRDLHAAISRGEFREDLYYRLAAVTITLPPLRNRRTDIAAIAERLLEQINRQFAAEEPGYRHKTLSASATAFVKGHSWPGNVRQLYNALVQTAVLTDGEKIGRRELAAAAGETLAAGAGDAAVADRPLGNGFNLDEHLNSIHKRYLERAMSEANGVKAEAARLLGMKNYQTLDAQLKRLGVREN
ncbi:sigma-54 interaction domain-containing protein [Candidatus Laterigemmans baculatus]|uniref:sigma-54 interaction domain-containing protein n=1 Tax=Candidatus Laterigemmans baculatus TaxID=2770505 RepID=UPI0013DAAD1C|nr:sigma-54 dependent transcriptional regulator [Candidatus Laterigemmans baculatus]